MISWVPKKNINLDEINLEITSCLQTKHFTNGGKNVLDLQNFIKKKFCIDDNKEVIVTCNGAAGLYSIIGGLNIYYDKKLRWAVQSFTFPCSHQGILMDSIIFDIDDNMGPNIEELNKRKHEYDGVIITNCFGTVCNIDIYENFCKENNKLLIFDNAASSYSIYKDKNILNCGDACMVSLHHTKPIGFGEGGFIIFDKKYLNEMDKSICFGFTKKNRNNYSIYANNYKMSEVSAIYISNFLKNFDNIYQCHSQLITYFIIMINKEKLSDFIELLPSFSDYNMCLLSCIPILFKTDISIDLFVENNIEAKKYYYPLGSEFIKAVDIFNRIICLPLTTDMNKQTIDCYIDIIKKIIHQG
jgi:dTDP-4-amino-4,6-dideoxygalactose transaminase